MKSQIIPVLLIAIAFPLVAAQLFQMEGHRESFRECRKVSFSQESFSDVGNNPSDHPVSYGELSNKQINYLIP